MKDREVYAGAALLGALAGMRSMAAPAVIGQLSQKGAFAEVNGPLAVVAHPRFGTVTGVLAVGELLADKLPFIPNRTAAGPLLGRALTGGFGGAVICSPRRRAMALGALIGAAAAVGTAFAAYELRRRVAKKWRVPDLAIALTEDAVVCLVGSALTSRFSSPAEF